jgi:hypothetical protein
MSSLAWDLMTMGEADIILLHETYLKNTTSSTPILQRRVTIGQSEINLAEFLFGIGVKHSTMQVLFKCSLGQ